MPHLVTFPVRHSPEGVREARQTVRAWMGVWNLPVDRDLVVLLVSEVVSNAVEHGGPPSSVHLLWEGSALKVSVRDALASSLPVLRFEDAGAESGRGIALLEALADRWGVEVATRSKTVWFEVGPVAIDDESLATHFRLWQDEVEPA